MKRILTALALAGMAATSAAADIGVSIAISQPGIYGRLDVGRYPAPVLVTPQPVWVSRPRVVAVAPEPVYLWVPPGHRRDWKHHCGRYRACGAPVYFVDDAWYRQHVMPPPRGRDGHPGRGRGHDKDHGRGHGRGHHD